MTSLLPINSTPLERAMESAGARPGEVAQILRTLYNPATCPAHLLPQLAWAWSVDRWDPGWSETVKRNAIRASFFIHARKGTIGALRRAVEPLGYLIEVIEWWQTVPQGPPATFALKVGVLDTGITEAMYAELTRLIDDAKPVSRHMTGLAISLETSGTIRFGAYVDQGEVIDIYPPTPRDIEVTGRFGQVACIDEIDTLDVYP
ncbi:phage tail protein I [Pseudomonas sp. MSSRFD41]|uniref:phage tail protein I n=1 Tax=Pseudomonas sp. MSSRFD41 TaxID=1310370 RepID=UPI0016397071|nr:phage tail protein I [Pseudomonas sp. MSSRFD41]MBC2658490.1 phage tail protein I [Pseudomonas sp. MSSRFD41]